MFLSWFTIVRNFHATAFRAVHLHGLEYPQQTFGVAELLSQTQSSLCSPSLGVWGEGDSRLPVGMLFPQTVPNPLFILVFMVLGFPQGFHGDRGLRGARVLCPLGKPNIEKQEERGGR